MVYMIPRQYKCPDCGTTTKWADNGGVASVPIIEGAPVCPVCWEKFVKANVPVMQLDNENECS